METSTSTEQWARSEFGNAELGDTRRTERLVRMAATAAERPSGRITQVFRTGAERQGAYDLLSNETVTSDELLSALGQATAKRCAGHDFVHVAVDGTSLALTDRAGSKDFGAIGSTNNGARGLKVVHSYAISNDGVPLGIVDQQWWCRVASKKRHDCAQRPLSDKETLHWVRTIEHATSVLSKAQVKAWFQIDREGDWYWTLRTLHDSGQWFTVRSTYAKRFIVAQGKRRTVRLREVMSDARVRYTASVRVSRCRERQERTARVQVRTAKVVLDMVEAYSGERLQLPVNVVDVREVGTTPCGEEPIHWRLLTNHPIGKRRDVDEVIQGYVKRWKIEDLHHSWKSGVCRIEQAQLRSASRMVKWAIVMVTVATRIERLKAVARSAPETPARRELSGHEIEAIRILRIKTQGCDDSIDPATLELGNAVKWIAELGGYVGSKSNGPPGAVTIRRGLERVTIVASTLQHLESEGKLR
jgi:hypothetical protein